MREHTRDYRFHAQKPMLGTPVDVQNPMTRHTMGCWLFTEGAGNTAVDSSLGGNHGTLVGGASRQGDSILLDGITGYVNVPHSPLLMPAQGITVAVKTRNLVIPAAYDVILMKTTNTGWGDGYGFYYVNANTVGFFVQNYSRVATATLNPLAENTLVGTYDGSRIRIRVNGVEGTPYMQTGAITANTAPLELGRGRDNLYNINGILRWVQILDAVV